MKLRPFFCYYGGKYRAAPHYPVPRYKTLIEPFAGAAGYATRYPDRNVILYDRDETIAGLWKYLIAVSEQEIRNLPVGISHVDEINGPQEAKWLAGFWLAKGTVHPQKSATRWMKDGTRPNSFWGEVIRERIASQLSAIRHWKVFHGSYESAPPFQATWFIDPPYIGDCGRLYRCNNVDFNRLGEWCRRRRGQVIVCEQQGATWLPFQPIGTFAALRGRCGKTYTKEAVWIYENGPRA